jgi:hypothetical protein
VTLNFGAEVHGQADTDRHAAHVLFWLTGLVRALQPAENGTYKAKFNTIQPLLEVRWSLTLRPATN